MPALITPAETAIVSSVVALGSVLVALRVAVAARRQTREERLWKARSDTYVDLLAWSIKQRELAKIRPDDHGRLAEIVLPSTEEQIALEARVSAFASRAVDEKVDEILPFWNRLRTAWGDMELLRDPTTDKSALRDSFHGIGQPEDRWTTAAREIERWAGELIGLVKTEMQSLRAMRR